MHDAVWDYVATAVQRHGPFRSVAEFGSKNINGTIRPLFVESEEYVGIDVNGGPDVDVVADAGEWGVADRYDCVVCTSALEHAKNAAEIVANACRVLLPGGCFIMTCAGPGWRPHSAIDEQPIRPDEFYENVTESMLLGWLEAAGFGHWIIDAGYDCCCVAWKGRKS